VRQKMFMYMILRQIYSGNYWPDFIRISTEFYRRYYKKILVSFFRTQCTRADCTWHAVSRSLRIRLALAITCRRRLSTLHVQLTCLACDTVRQKSELDYVVTYWHQWPVQDLVTCTPTTVPEQFIGDKLPRYFPIYFLKELSVSVQAI